MNQLVRPRVSALRRVLPVALCASLVGGAGALVGPLLLAGTGVATAHGAAAAEITWTATLADAKAAAEAGDKVIFIAINMDGERANDTLAKDVYHDKTIVALAAETVNLVASAGVHGKGECARFGGLTCEQHQQVDIRVRHDVLNVTTGPVVAPQHVFLGPDSKVLLSVPYEVTAGELEWCFHEARRLADATYVAKPTGKSQKPRRLVVAGVETAATKGPMTRARALELIANLRKGVGQHHEVIYELATADEPEAQDEIRKFLRQGPQMGRDGTIGTDWRPPLMRWVGEVSPASYWELMNDFIGAGELTLRREAIVAMEQLAAPQGLPELMKQVRKEKDQQVTGSLWRAIGACGAKDAKARAALLKATKGKDALARRSALLGLGWSEPNEDVQECLAAMLAGTDEVERAAAAVAMGLSRDARWIPVLEPLVAEGSSAPEVVRSCGAAALEVLRGASYERLGPSLKRIADDDIPRARLFGGGP